MATRLLNFIGLSANGLGATRHFPYFPSFPNFPIGKYGKYENREKYGKNGRRRVARTPAGLVGAGPTLATGPSNFTGMMADSPEPLHTVHTFHTFHSVQTPQSGSSESVQSMESAEWPRHLRVRSGQAGRGAPCRCRRDVELLRTNSRDHGGWPTITTRQQPCGHGGARPGSPRPGPQVCGPLNAFHTSRILRAFHSFRSSRFGSMESAESVE